MNERSISRVAYSPKVSTRLASVVDALRQSCEEGQKIEAILFKADACSHAGGLLAQVRLILVRAGCGLPARRSDFLSILNAATQLSGERR